MAQTVINFGGVPAATSTRKISTNAAQTLADVAAYSASNAIIGAIITCETNDIRFAFGGAIPTHNGAASVCGHVLYVGQSIVLGSGSAVRTMQFISNVTGAHGNLIVTPLLERG